MLHNHKRGLPTSDHQGQDPLLLAQFLCCIHGRHKSYTPQGLDVILVGPKGSGRTVRTLFKESFEINSSAAVFQDVTGKAVEKAVAIGVAIGSRYMYETTFEKEVYSDLYGERGVLLGAIQGLFCAQYRVLRANGHSPSG
ncbi:hypothetical protein C8R48DRAFT_792838 [Suillus tomentosus]|nr:hypothetical protein C8R48DRAFT_792838 [Suillus tomentosus]